LKTDAAAVANADLVAQATVGTQMRLKIEAAHVFSARFWYESADFPPNGDSNSALLPDSISIAASGEYGIQLWEATAYESCVGPGEVRRTVSENDIAILASTKISPTPKYWEAAPMREVLAWSVCPLPPHSGVHTFRYYTLKDAVRAACPAYGMEAFFSIRGRPVLMGNLPVTGPRQTERVVLAAPLGCVKQPVRGLSVGTLVPIIDENADHYKITAIGRPSVFEVPKSKLVVVCPLQIEYAFYQSRATIHFRRCILDHFAFYEDMCNK
jgi:hypothetical protein